MRSLFALPLLAHLLIFTPLAVVLLISGFTDLSRQKIWNEVTYPGIVAGLLLSLVVYSPYEAVIHLVSVVGVFSIGILVMLPGWMGGGDIKLLMVVSAFLGPAGLIQSLLYSFAIGLIWALTYSISKGYITQVFLNLWRMLRAVFRMLYYRTTNVSYGLKVEDQRSYIPFGAAICLGVFCLYAEYRFGLEGLIYCMKQL